VGHAVVVVCLWFGVVVLYMNTLADSRTSTPSACQSVATETTRKNSKEALDIRLERLFKRQAVHYIDSRSREQAQAEGTHTVVIVSVWILIGICDVVNHLAAVVLIDGLLLALRRASGSLTGVVN
jgi:hypothetical protein